MDTTAFYTTMSALCFALVGFWWVVVQFRHEEMTRNRATRRFTFIVLIQFLIPGFVALPSLLSAEPLWWRLAFGLAWILGATAAIAGTLGTLDGLRWYAWLSVPVYIAVTVFALIPDLARHLLTVSLEPLQVEGLLLLALVLLGVLIAWGTFTRPMSDTSTS